MVTNLIFKRTVNIEGSSRTEVKVVEVDVPGIRSNEGWILINAADAVSVTKKEPESALAPSNPVTNLIKPTNQESATQAAILTPIQPQPVIKEVKVAPLNAKDILEQRVIREAEDIDEYPSDIDGTACLIRRDNTIRIAYCRGSKGKVNNRNKVCISDEAKERFFNAVRAENHGNDVEDWYLKYFPGIHGKYDIWNKFIDTEYEQQKKDYVRKKVLASK